MHLRFFPFELLLLVLAIVRTAIPDHFTELWFGIAFAVLIILKGLLECLRQNTFFFLVGLGIQFIDSYIAIGIGLASVLFAIVFFPVYSYPKPSGPYMVGFRDISLNNG